MNIKEYTSTFWKGIASLLIGMKTTMKIFFRKKITEAYPENRATMYVSKRFRGELIMPHDANNEHKCIACGICQNNCPNDTILITTNTITTEEGKSKKVLASYQYDLGSCLFCELCVTTCPHDAIQFTNTFENAVFRQSKLVYNLNKEGSKVQDKKAVVKKQVETPVAATEPTIPDTNLLTDK